MKIKNFTLLLAGMTMGFASCNLDSDPESNYMIGEYTACNHVSSIDGDAFVTNASYKLTIYYTEGLASLSTANLSLGYGTKNFATTNMPYTVKYVGDQTTGYYDMTSFTGGTSNQEGLTITNVKGTASSGVNILGPKDPQLTGYEFKPYIPIVLSYNVNDDYTVKTFAKDAIYNGTTNVRNAASGDIFTNNDVRYRVVFSEDFKKADVIFYDAKFASRMEPITFVLKGLSVNITKAGYTITNPEGEVIIPLWWESNGFTEMENYPVTSFLLTNVSDNLTMATVNYTVALGPITYNCDFTGQYVYLGEN